MEGVGGEELDGERERNGGGEGGKLTAVVLNADGEGDGAERGGNVGWVRGIDRDDLVRARVVRGAGGDAEQIFVCHSTRKKKK